MYDGDSDENGDEEGEDDSDECDSGDVSGGEDCDDQYPGDDSDGGEHVSGGEDDSDKCLGDDGDGDGSDSGEEETSSRKSDVDGQEVDRNGSLDRLEGTNDEKHDRVDVEESRKLVSKSGDINSDNGSDDGSDDEDDDDDSGRDVDSGDDLDQFGEYDDKQMLSNGTNSSTEKKKRKGQKQPISKDLAKVSQELTFLL